MLKRFSMIVLGAALGLGLAGCAGEATPGEDAAGIPSPAATPPAATAIDKVLGDSDLSLAYQSRQRALEYAPSGLAVSWRNPGTGDSGSYVAQRAFATNAGQYCREFRQTVTVKGETREDRGTACRRADGTWLLAP